MPNTIPTDQAVLGQKQAAEYLGVNFRWLDDAPLPWVDLRKPGSLRPIKRWRIADLDAFVTARITKPGERNKQQTN